MILKDLTFYVVRPSPVRGRCGAPASPGDHPPAFPERTHADPPAEGAADGSVSFHVTAGSRDAPAVGSVAGGSVGPDQARRRRSANTALPNRPTTPSSPARS